MTFTVDWRFDDGTPIPVLDEELPDGWRELFELAAASRTGRGQPTSARCTYPESSERLVCEFDNPGHRSDAEGLIVPARPTATYAVTVTWEQPDWSIDGADGGPYSARDLCPRGGGGHDGDQSGGHDAGHDNLSDDVDDVDDVDDADQTRRTFVCEHTVVIQQVQRVTPEPEPQPEPEQPAPVQPAPVLPADRQPRPSSAEPPAATTAPTSEASPSAVRSVASVPRSLPATGGRVSTMLAIAVVLSAIGAVFTLLARRPTATIGGGSVDRERMLS